MTSRRTFLGGLGAAAIGSALPIDSMLRLAEAVAPPLYPPIDLSYFETPIAAAPSDIKFGYAAITWNGQDLQAIDDVAAVGFPGIQLRSNVLKEFAVKHNLSWVGRMDFFPHETWRKGTDGQSHQVTEWWAVAHAIDREAITKNLVGPASEVIHSACHPDQFACAADVTKYADELLVSLFDGSSAAILAKTQLGILRPELISVVSLRTFEVAAERMGTSANEFAIAVGFVGGLAFALLALVLHIMPLRRGTSPVSLIVGKGQ